jgi:hypothetical protein
VGDDYVIEDSWIHSTTAGPDDEWHVDGVSSSGGRNGIIRHNTIVLGHGEGVTGTVNLGSSLGPIDNVLVENNFLANGAYCVFVFERGHPATGIRVVGNQFSLAEQPRVGEHGIWYPTDVPADLVREGNVIVETGASADREPDWEA